MIIRLYIEGGRLITHEFQREWPEIKSTNYLNSLILDSIRKEQDAVDILYLTRDGVSECSRSNFFMLRNNKLITPSSKILEGITRKIILNLSKNIFEVEERTVLQNEIKTAEEVFITSTSKGLMPIVQIDNHLIGRGKVGKGTSKLSLLFEKYIENY